MEHDFDRPFRDQSSMQTFRATNKQDARRFGPIVKAMTITNREYSHRYSRLAKQNNMKDPPSSATHIMVGHLVVRRLGTDRQYETWMPSDVFEEIYEEHSSNSSASK